MDDSLQTNAVDTAQIDFARRKAKEAESRRRQLWRGLLEGKLTPREGREFVCDVLFGDVGVMRPIEARTIDELHARVALHNLSTRWLRDDVMPNRELYMQMQNEQLKRGQELARELAAFHEQHAKDSATT